MQERISLNHAMLIMRAAEKAGLAHWTDDDDQFVLGPELTAIRKEMGAEQPSSMTNLVPAESQAMEALIGMN